MTCCPTRTSARSYDRGEIDEDGNPKMPFGSGFGGYSRGRRRAAARRRRGLREFQLRRRRRGRPQRPVRRPVRRPPARGRPAAGGFGGFRQRARAPQKGADVAYRLKVPFVDAVALKPQRITLADGKTIDLKLPKGLEDGTKIRLAGKGAGGARRARRRDRHDRDRAAPLLHPRRQQHPARRCR